MNEQTSDLLRQISRYIFIGIAALLVLLLLLALFRVSVGFWLWSTVETWATVRLGLDSDAAQLVTVILVSAITLLLPTLAWYFLWGKKQIWATGAVVGGQILIFLLVSTIGSGVCFDRSTGEPLCWYADIPSKRRVFSRTKGFDPETGIEYKQYTREIAFASSSPTVIPKSQSNSQTEISQQNVKATESKSLTVKSESSAWTDSGFDVRAGDTIKVQASGVVNHGGQNSNPDGNPSLIPQGNAVVPNARYGALVGLIGSSNTFTVGSSFEQTLSQSGRLKFLVNDGNGQHADNSGSYTLKVTIIRSP